MKFLTLLCLFLLAFPSFNFADNHSENNSNFKASEKRYDDLKSEIHDIKYDLREQITHQQITIKEQDKAIVELRLKIRDLENQVFQTTQSLRNLELEVWDKNKASHH